MKYIIEKEDDKIVDVYQVVDETPSVYLATLRWTKQNKKQSQIEIDVEFRKVFEKTEELLVEESIK